MSQRNEDSRPSHYRGMTAWLIHQAARRAPDSLSSRLEEEWLADLQSRKAVLSRLSFALGCCWASVVILNEQPARRVALASSAANRGFVGFPDRGVRYFSLRSATLFLIAGLHAALFYGLFTTLQHTHGIATPADLQNRAVAPVLPQPVPPATGMTSKDWRINIRDWIHVEPREVNVQGDVTTKVDNGSEPYLPSAGADPVAPAVKHVGGGPGTGFPETRDYYPAASIRLGEEGLSTVTLCVDAGGRVTAAPITASGSGFARLDEAALKLARAGTGHYRASTEDGKPVASCYSFAVRFQLRK